MRVYKKSGLLHQITKVNMHTPNVEVYREAEKRLSLKGSVVWWISIQMLTVKWMRYCSGGERGQKANIRSNGSLQEAVYCGLNIPKIYEAVHFTRVSKAGIRVLRCRPT